MKRILYLFAAGLFLFISALPYASLAQPEKTTAPNEQAQLQTLTEQKVYIPYENLKDVLEKKDKGIFIPYSDFIQLWEQATKKPPEKLLPPPPIDAAIIHAHYKGTVFEDTAEFHAELRISALKEKWSKIFLNMKDIAVTSLSLDSQTPLLKPVDGGMELVLPEKGDYILQMDFSARVDAQPGKKFISFQIPSSPLTKIDMTLPGKDLDVKITPMLSKKSSVIGETTEFSAFLSPEGKVNISWLSKSVEAKTGRSLIFAKLSSVVMVKESVYLMNTQFGLSVLQAKTDTFRIKMPADLSLVSVDGKNIKDWDLGDDGVLTVTLYEKIDGDYAFSINTEKYRDVEEKTFDVPQFEVMDAKREDGEIIIKADPSLRVQVGKKDKVTQIDPSELKGKITLGEFVSAFRYFRRPFLVRLNVSKIQPRITAEQNILISFKESLIDYQSDVHFKIKDAGVFKFRFLLPEGFRVVDVGSEENVDSYSLSQENGQNILTVVLKNRALGDFVLPIHLESDKEDRDISLALPKLQCLDIEKEDGIIAFSIRKNLKLSTGDIRSLRPISLEELQSLGIHVIDDRNEIAAGYRYATSDYSCFLQIEKRETKIIARVERNVDIEETAMKIVDIIRYEILYAPTRLFRVEVPESIGKNAVITGDNIKEKRYSVDEKTKNGIWEVELHAPTMNQFTLGVSFEKKLESIKTGEKRTIPVPDIRILDVFNESGFVSVMKSPNLQVEAKENNLEPIDAKELPSGMDRTRSVLSFRYLSHPYSLVIETTKHEYEKILDAIVNQAHFDIVVSKEGIAKAEGVFKIQNTNRQSLELRMPEGTDKIYSVFISGKKASISKGSTEWAKIVMLPKDIAPGSEFTLRIIYESRLKKDFGFFGGIRIENAEIKDVPCSKTTWRLYLPHDYSYIYMHGSMNPARGDDYAFQNVNSTIPSQRIYSEQSVSYSENQILQQNDEKSLYGLDVEIVREGQLYFFSKLDKEAHLSILFVKKAVMLPFSLIIVALTGWLLTRVACHKSLSKTKVIAVSIAAAFLLRIFVPQGFKYFASLLIFGIALAGAALVFLFLREQKKLPLKAADKKPEGTIQS
ncbi:MAG: hypothetical protein JW928_07910 [Candidatus Aureabacteria bacterium]|nr:hypothetical protein [Candidatus Auribacterota bacterium]